MSILARGGGKSTEVEPGPRRLAILALRRYALYCSDTQKQANDHIANVAGALEALGVERAINRYGFSRAGTRCGSARPTALPSMPWGWMPPCVACALTKRGRT